MWLDRAAHIPLYVRLALFTASWKNYQPAEFRGSETIAYLNFTRYHWKVLEWEIPFRFLELFRGHEIFPMTMDRLSFSLAGVIWTVLNKHPLFTTQPRPQQLVLFCSGSFFPSKNDIEWCNLTKYEGSYIPTGVAAEVLLQAPRLEDCTLILYLEDGDSVYTRTTPITHLA